jgi:glyoxylase-like metal-dependent hydrolase (beta-lactamase superfamily II)
MLKPARGRRIRVTTTTAPPVDGNAFRRNVCRPVVGSKDFDAGAGSAMHPARAIVLAPRRGRRIFGDHHAGRPFFRIRQRLTPLLVAPDVWRITTPLPFRPRSVHAYLARLGADRWMLVDGGLGTDEAWAALDAGVREAAGGWNAVCLHFVTHMHMDHLGLTARARTAAPAAVVMGELDASRMTSAAADPEGEAAYRADLLRRAGAPAEMRAGVQQVAERTAPLAPAFEVQLPLRGEGGTVPGATGWEWIWTPGHTAGHVSLIRSEDRVVIAGDAVLPRITPTLGVNRQRADPVGDYLAALDRLRAATPSLILPGHGDPVGAERITELRAAAEAEGEAVLAALGAGPSTPWQTVERRYAGRDFAVSTHMLALRETRAHLDRLAAAGRVTREPGDDGADLFTPAA